jgi:hypothetical protein
MFVFRLWTGVMEENLISKRELLEQTGISYGQLYRWKRKNLIPEDWFIRKSSYTGQETFFPKDKILERVEKIINMKENLSLDNLADMFSPDSSQIIMSVNEMIKRNIVSQASLNLFLELSGNIESLGFEQIICIYILDKMLVSGSINLDEGKMLLKTLNDNFKNFEANDFEMVFTRKYGISSCFLLALPNQLYIDINTKIIEKVTISNIIEEIKIKFLK